MFTRPKSPEMEKAQAKKISPNHIFVKMLERKKIIQQHIREGRVSELQEKEIKVVKPF